MPIYVKGVGRQRRCRILMFWTLLCASTHSPAINTRSDKIRDVRNSAAYEMLQQHGARLCNDRQIEIA